MLGGRNSGDKNFRPALICERVQWEYSLPKNVRERLRLEHLLTMKWLENRFHLSERRIRVDIQNLHRRVFYPALAAVCRN